MSDSSIFKAYQGNTYLFGGNAPYVEEMYENYLANPGSVPDSWREYFDNLQHLPAVDGTNSRDIPHMPVINAFAERAKQGGTQVVFANPDVELGRKRQVRIDRWRRCTLDRLPRGRAAEAGGDDPRIAAAVGVEQRDTAMQVVQRAGIRQHGEALAADEELRTDLRRRALKRRVLRHEVVLRARRRGRFRA